MKTTKVFAALVLTLFATPGFATQVEWVRHSRHGVEQILLLLEGDGKTNQLYTNSNFMSVGHPVRIGLFKRDKAGDEFPQLIQIASQKGSLKSLKAKWASPHVGKIFLDGVLVPYDSDPYRKLEALLEREMKNPSWMFIEGDLIRSADTKSIVVESWKTKTRLYTKTLPAKDVCKTIASEHVCAIPAGYFYP